MGSAFESIRQGLTEAISHAKGEVSGVKVYRPAPVDVALIRRNLGMTQEEFSARFGFSVATLRHWERGDRHPSGSALVLLNVIENSPEAVINALAKTRVENHVHG